MLRRFLALLLVVGIAGGVYWNVVPEEVKEYYEEKEEEERRYRSRKLVEYSMGVDEYGRCYRYYIMPQKEKE